MYLKMIFNQENRTIRYSNKQSVVRAFETGIGFSNLDQRPNSSQSETIQQVAAGCATGLAMPAVRPRVWVGSFPGAGVRQPFFTALSCKSQLLFGAEPKPLVSFLFNG